MEHHMNLRDIPKWAFKELKAADFAHTEELLNVAIEFTAICQQKVELRTLCFTLQANGDVLVSTAFDAEGKSAVPYARIDRVTRQMTTMGQTKHEGVSLSENHIRT
jgi:hypothetical protein